LLNLTFYISRIFVPNVFAHRGRAIDERSNHPQQPMARSPVQQPVRLGLNVGLLKRSGTQPVRLWHNAL